MIALEVIGSLLGLVYVWLEYRASIRLWMVCVLMSAVYIVVFYRAGVYASCGINAYYLLASVYGWIVWRRRSGADAAPECSISHIPRRRWLWPALTAFVCWLLLGGLLVTCTDSIVPWVDAFTTAVSMVALWMLAQKYVEQWLLWLLVNVVSAGLYAYMKLPFTAALYAFYAVVAVPGYVRWKKIMKEERSNQ